MQVTSILIPVYNREALVIDAIESALAQSINDIEVVVVDNCSTDGTWDAVRAVAARDSRIKPTRNEANLGPVGNWRRCAHLATGRFATLLFSDDTLAPGFVARLRDWISDERVGFAYTSARRVGAHGAESVLYSRLPEGVLRTSAFVKEALCDLRGTAVPASPGCAMFRLADLREALRTNWSDEPPYRYLSTGAGPDVWTFLHAARRYPLFAHVAEPLVTFREHEANLSRRPEVPAAYAGARKRFVDETPELPRETIREFAVAEAYRRWRSGLSSGMQSICDALREGSLAAALAVATRHMLSRPRRAC